MPVCKACDKHFPVRIKVDGIVRNTQRRKYCFECSPWGLHNTRPLVLDTDGVIKTVTEANEGAFACKCGKIYEAVRSLGHDSTSCNSCRANDRRFDLKERAVAYKGGSCQRCGYSRNRCALQFHHLDPSQKDFQIGGHHGRSWDILKLELDKCILVCANCHSEIHAEQLQQEKTLSLIKIIKAVKLNNKLKPCKALRDHPLWE